MRNWRRAIDITSELGVSRMVSEFNGRPEAVSKSENQFLKSLEELLPIFERRRSTWSWNRTPTISSRTVSRRSM